MRGRFALVCEVGGEDHFLHGAVAHARLQPVEADVARAHAIERRQTTHQREVYAGIGKCLLHHRQVGGRFHHAKQGRIAPRRAAQRADLIFAEVVALGAAAHGGERLGERLRELVGAWPIMLQQVVGHALRRARPHTGKRAQRLDQALEALRRRDGVAVQNGSLNPAGRPRPAVMPLIFSAIVASTLRAASLNAAATRSSSISLSSPTSEGSMLTRFTSYLQVICTLTRPPPDWPSTSSVPRLSCMRRMFSCIICACFISCPMLPFICVLP